MVWLPDWLALEMIGAALAFASIASCRRDMLLAHAADAAAGAAGLLFTAALAGPVVAAASLAVGAALWLVWRRLTGVKPPLNLALAPALAVTYILLLTAVRAAGRARRLLAAAMTAFVYATPMLAMLLSLWALKLASNPPAAPSGKALARLGEDDYALVEVDVLTIDRLVTPEPEWVSPEPPLKLRLIKLLCSIHVNTVEVEL